MKNSMKHKCILSAVLACGLGLAAQTFAQALSAAEQMALNVKMNEFQLAKKTDPLLNHPHVSDTDKEKVKAAVKPMRDAMDKFAADLKAAGTDAAAYAKLESAQPKIVELSHRLIELLNSRRDLQWIVNRAEAISSLEGQLLREKPEDYLARAKQAGLGADDQARIKKVIDTYHADIEKLNKETSGPMRTIAFSERTQVASRNIRAGLKPEQIADLEWALTHGPNVDDPLFNFLGFSAQPDALKAPEDGVYNLNEYDEKDPASPAKVSATVTLKKGDPLGFKKSDKGLVAFAGSEITELTEGYVSTWEFQKP